MGAADVETKFVSVERVAEYMRLPSEAAEVAEATWPASLRGEVRLEGAPR